MKYVGAVLLAVAAVLATYAAWQSRLVLVGVAAILAVLAAVLLVAGAAKPRKKRRRSKVRRGF